MVLVNGKESKIGEKEVEQIFFYFQPFLLGMEKGNLSERKSHMFSCVRKMGAKKACEYAG